MSKGDYQSIIESCWDVMSYGIFNIRPNQDPDDPFQTLLTIYNRYFTHFIFDYDRHEAIPGSLQDLLKEFGQPNSLKASYMGQQPSKKSEGKASDARSSRWWLCCLPCSTLILYGDSVLPDFRRVLSKGKAYWNTVSPEDNLKIFLVTFQISCSGITV